MSNCVKKVIWSATPTPFLDSGALDLASLERVVEHHVKMGVSGLFLGGTCGEGPFMPDSQRLELVRETKRLAAGRLQLALQVSDTSAARVVENIHAAEGAGADYVVVAPPWISRFCNSNFARRYFSEAIEAARLPVGLYVLAQPPETGIDMSLWCEFAAHPKVKILKDSSCNDEYAAAFVELRQKRDDLLLLTGFEFDVVKTLNMGYDGGLLGTAIIISGLMHKLLEALESGDTATAVQWQERANGLMYDIFGRDIGLWMGGLKHALRLMGLFSTEFMHLGYKLTDAERSRIAAALEREAEFL
ncbi:MAG: dihydrodipicolinate synthase family protein [Lentisphaerae bacterium]|nr:dihydrodipicolinate synthase family protein [Lentisphaerota bacterium]